MSEMPDILRRIVRAKQEEVRALRAADIRALEERADRQEPARGFRAALAGAHGVALVAEVKKASPSAGVIREDFDPVEIARAYERGGAAAVSILTDRQFFRGEAVFLEQARRAVRLPLLRKDFLLDPLQVLESRAIGADACLLIAGALKRPELDELLRAVRALSMDALVEVHDEAELDAALSAGADLVGINNRNLRTFEVNIEVAERLAPRVPEGVLLVAESGIKTAADVRRLYACGVKAVLVGEALMREPDVESAVRRLLGGSF